MVLTAILFLAWVLGSLQPGRRLVLVHFHVCCSSPGSKLRNIKSALFGEKHARKLVRFCMSHENLNRKPQLPLITHTEDSSVLRGGRTGGANRSRQEDDDYEHAGEDLMVGRPMSCVPGYFEVINTIL